MDVVSSVVEKVKGFSISSQNFVNSLVQRHQTSNSCNPIEILKRLQREAFSDLMKLRDRQDKVERVLSFYKTAKGSPFQEASTHVRGEVDFLGGILMMRGIDSQHMDALDRAGIRTGITSRFIFETSFGQNDSLVAELIASETGNGSLLSDVSGIPLSLSKLSYAANVSDWCSATAIPVGAQCRDFDTTKNSSHQKKGLTYISSFEPPLLTQHNGSAIGVTVRKSTVVASLAQSVSGRGMPLGSVGFGYYLNTFGQVVCQLPRGIKLSLMGLHQVPKVLDYCLSAALAVPVGFLEHHNSPERTVEAAGPASSLRIHTPIMPRTGSIALKLESELDASTKVGGWIEMLNSNYKHLRWAITISDTTEDDIGWGVNLSGIEGPTGWKQYQFESFADLSLGKRFNLKPGVAYVVDGDAKILALMLRCNWSL